MSSGYVLDEANSDIDNVWIDIVPVMVTAKAELYTTNGSNHYVGFVLLQPSLELEEEDDYRDEMLECKFKLGDYSEERSLVVETAGEYCTINVYRDQKLEVYFQIKHEIGEGIVVDLFDAQDEPIRELGCVLYDDIRAY